MKNASRSKFLLCFRPEVDMEMVVESKPARKARTKLIENTKVEKTKVVKNEEEMRVVQAPLTKTMSLDRDCSMISSQSSKLPRSRHNRTLSKVFQAVVFGTILTKKVREGRTFRRDSFGSKREYNLSSGSDEMMITPIESNSDQVRVDSSSNPDSEKQSTKNQEDSVKKSKKNKKGSCELNSGMCLLLISLGITVFWGRVVAILFTSIWLYFFSWRWATSDLRRPENVRNGGGVQGAEEEGHNGRVD